MASKAYESVNCQTILSLVLMLKLREAKNWAIIGMKSFARIQCALFVELYGKKALSSKDCLNEFYADAVTMRE